MRASTPTRTARVESEERGGDMVGTRSLEDREQVLSARQSLTEELPYVLQSCSS